MGDMIEAITIDDRRYDMATTSEPLPLQQVKDAIETLRPISGRLLTILKGNHEHNLWKFGDLAAEIASTLGVDYGTYSAKLTISNKEGEYLYKIFVTHGRKGITSTADDPKRRFVTMELILKRHLKFMHGDCVINAKGHSHKLLVCEPEQELYLTDDGTKIKQKYISTSQNAPYIHPDHRYYISTGSFYKLYGPDGVSGYAEMSEYPPLELGYVIAVIRDNKLLGVDKVVL